ncbi:sirohydrochlorin chelatase [Sphaerisporangium dianthi]|uniref:Sirohydrochlorin chelatase n=1 Tax=Sphaerisporangium dianthi TaxID=1436120 RepID=A0ABV9CGL6_9ACTN
MAVAHGSRDPRASATVAALLDGVRLARPGIDVHAAYLDHSRPSLGEALAGIDGAVVLPLLLTEAYHSRVDIPAALREAVATRPGLRVHQGATLGPHPLLITALERRLAEAGVEIGDPDTAVVLVSAGSSDARANAVIARMAREWARSGGWHSVTPAYASACSPTPEDAVRELLAGRPGPTTNHRTDPANPHRTEPSSPLQTERFFPPRTEPSSPRRAASRVVVASYLLAPGHFADKVRTNTLRAGAHAVAAPLGQAPELPAILLERYAQALPRTFQPRIPIPATI